MDLIRLTHDDVMKYIPDRDIYAHKGDFGRILLLCGSLGYTGAATLAAMGALRTGAGLVYLGVPQSIYQIEAIKLTEPIVFPLPDHEGRFSSRANQLILSYLSKMDAVLIGPGIGQSNECFEFLKFVLENYDGPVVLDADGINLIAEHKDILRGRKGATVLTPHAGEFARVSNKTVDCPLDDAVQLARDLNVIVLLKGHETVITDGKKAYINKTGNPGMAVGGSGDVLAGMITSLIGQGVSVLEAAACGAWLHGRAGDICAETIGQYGMIPSDMLQVIPQLLK